MNLIMVNNRCSYTLKGSAIDTRVRAYYHEFTIHSPH